MANCKHTPALTSTWDHEAHHETHGAGEQDDPDDPLHDVSAVLCDVLETVERGLSTVALALFCQPRHLTLGSGLTQIQTEVTQLVTASSEKIVNLSLITWL